ncbi:SRPBCC family protein [Flavitalea sp. BT771]|uniref:SRPBCC family protein n=1 Tax=Flavitalea sp. BT771 TaxID=3063329 RepID=UPI0026E3BA67|nr:SRPBCC family protein [Flavitalea sp. BT771]MDO6432782.1 SRPBCC family protein [Flavitalea sp. BT771]MDV6221942.1 SRPBCC family protein [Flavitalea sp. BT771]
MKLLLSVFFASFYGLTIRLLFDFFDGSLGIMSLSFFFLVPFLVGYLTVLLLPYKENHTATGAFFKALLPCMVIMAITLALNVEGLICWIMASPIIIIFAGFGGVMAFNRKKRRAMAKALWDFEKEDWQKPGSLKISFLFLLPLLAGAIEGDSTSSSKALTIEKQIELRAAPGAVWNALIAGSRTLAGPRRTTLSGLMGFPRHLSTTMQTPAVGGTRIATYEKGLEFVEAIKKIEPGRSLTLEITTDPSKISKAIMDEHIVIGGDHIKMGEDGYRLEPLPNGGTRLLLYSRFYIHTPFNWYAGIWARLLMSDVLRDELYSQTHAL